MADISNHEHLEKVCAEATAGEWSGWRPTDAKTWWVLATEAANTPTVASGLSDANATFISTFDPPTVQALLTELRETKAERDAARDALETFAILANADTDCLPDEHVISLTYDDSALDDDLGGQNTLLGERYMRAFRRAREALRSLKGSGDIAKDPAP